MSNLTIFNSEIIPVYTTDTGEKIVLGRELHEKLDISTAYKDWFPRMAEYGFSEGVDYSPLVETVDAQKRARTYTQQNHLLKLDMAKHIAMIQRTAQGKEIRDKLIALETNVSSLSPELRLLINMEMQQRVQTKALADTNARLDGICDIVALNPTAWREDARRLIVQIAQAWGGNDHIRDVNAEVFRLVDTRAGASLSARLQNMRQRMAEEGTCKSKRDKLSKVDVIEKDKKLIEIYLAIVKEMAIQNGVGQQPA